MRLRNCMILLGLLVWVLSPFVGWAADPPAAIFPLEVRGRRLVGKTTSVRVKRGEAVTLRWTSDETVNIHLHGYDIEKVVTPEAPTEFNFTAYATGRFPITAHGFGTHAHGDEHDEHEETLLLYFEVYPR